MNPRTRTRLNVSPHLLLLAGVVVVFVFQLHMTSEMNNDFLHSFLRELVAADQTQWSISLETD